MYKRIIAAALLLPAGRLLADDSSSTLSPVIVTATRTEQAADASLSSVSVITRQDIERLQPQSVQDLLVGLPGVAVANDGGLGKTTSVFLRGTDSDQVLVLLDGIKLGSATTGTAAFEQIPVDQIERIEIVRGPRSSLYGSEAVGGVIQIFTRRGAPDQAPTPSFSVGGGTYNTWQGEAGVTGGLHNAWYSAGASGLYTGGIDACRGVGAPTYAGCGVVEPDRDGYWTSAASLRGGYRFDDGAELSGDWLRAYGDTKYDGSFQNESRVVQQVLGGNAVLPQIGPWRAAVTGGQSEDYSTNFENGSFAGFFNTLRNSVSWQNDFSIAPRQTFTAGADYLKDHIVSDTAFPVTSREDFAGFAQYQGGFGHNDAQLSLRSDHNQQFGEHYTGAGAWGYQFGQALRLYASYGTAFRAPTFNELYFPGFGNPLLKPEKSRSAELGVGGRPGAWNYALNLYQTRIDELIAFDATFTPSNIDTARIRGLEAQLGWHHDGWRSQLDLSLLAPRNLTAGAEQGNLLPRRPQETGRFDLDRDLGRFSAGTTVFVSSHRYDDLANTQRLGGYATFDFRAACRLIPHWQLQARLANAFNKHYETAQYFNQPGRSVFVTLRYLPMSL
jgi:vitamin B12 transporter